MSDLFDNPESEYHELANSTAAQQIMNSCNIELELKDKALYDISKMQTDVRYAQILGYRNDEELGTAFNWFQSELGGDFWGLLFNQLNDI